MALLFQDLATLVQLQEPLKRLKDPYNVGAPDARFSEMGSHNLRCCGVGGGVGGQPPPIPQAKRCTGKARASQSDATSEAMHGLRWVGCIASRCNPSGAKRCNPKRSKAMQPQAAQIDARASPPPTQANRCTGKGLFNGQRGASLLCYLKLTDACQTKARSKKSTGIIGNTSTIGSKGAYASGNFASKKAINYKSILYEV